MVQVFHPPQDYDRQQFWDGCSYGIKNYSVEVTFIGMASI
jgi:hypothetical protein